jgi:2-polyprenyl-6-hydroxyphenyl methylase/3-demethylubiquinone-9 3-methyltransferase
MEVIEHINDKDLFVNSLSNLVKSNGILFISTMSKNYESYFKLIFLAEYLTNLVPIGTHNWEKFIDP